jgi:hypothetical protein
MVFITKNMINNMINTKNITNILIIFLIIFVILIYFKFNDKQIHIDNINKNDITFRKCGHLKNHETIKKVLDENNINKSMKDWDIYLPCGYNYVEGELQTIKVKNSNQRIFAIKGCDKIASKNNLWKILRDYYGRPKASKLMPETYIISDPADMKIFQQNYSPDRLYLLKKNVQRKEGIILTHDYNKIMKHTDYKVVQEYVDNLYILKKRKINLRLYLLIVCKEGKVSGYLYNKGKCIYTNKDFSNKDSSASNFDKINSNKEVRETHLTSVNLDTSIYDTYPETLENLEEYMGQNQFNKLWNRILNLFQDLMDAIQGHVCDLKSLDKVLTFQLFGADIIFDTKLNPYLLELNKGPSMKYMTKIDEKMKDNLTNDIFIKVGVINKEPINKFITLN